jgi:hypothetical protein
MTANQRLAKPRARKRLLADEIPVDAPLEQERTGKVERGAEVVPSEGRVGEEWRREDDLVRGWEVVGGGSGTKSSRQLMVTRRSTNLD